MTLAELQILSVSEGITLRDTILYELYLEASGLQTEYRIKNIIKHLPLAEDGTDPHTVDGALFASIENTGTGDVLIDGEALPPNSVYTFPNAGNVKQVSFEIDCLTNSTTATLIWQQKRIL